MRLVELPAPPLEGELNTSCFVVDSQGKILLKRNPKNNRQILKSIEHEYHFIGFTDRGGKFRKRTPQEQISFVRNAASHGLRVLSPALVDRGIAYYHFFSQAKTLDDYLPFSSDEDLFRIVYELFNDLRKAHKENIIYGDRWSRNILVIPKSGVLNIDFDIEISGKPAKEFEIAQMAYYTLCAGKDRVIPLLAAILSHRDDLSDFSLVAGFLQRHAIHFLHNPKYGGIEKETDVLIRLVNQKKIHINNLNEKNCLS